VTQPEVIYAHALNLTSEFLTNLLKMLLNVGLQAKCSRLIGNLCRWIHFWWQISTGSKINVLTPHVQTVSSQKSLKMASCARITTSL